MGVAKAVIVVEVPTRNPARKMLEHLSEPTLWPYLVMPRVEAHPHRGWQVSKQFPQIGPRVVRHIFDRQSATRSLKFLTEPGGQCDVAG